MDYRRGRQLAAARISCPTPARLIDLLERWREGGHALWLNGDKMRIETNNDVRGDRPWVIKPVIKPKGPRWPARKVAAAGKDGL